MANSMDTILVKYSGSKEAILIQEFLAKNPKELTEDEQKIQEATQIIYDLNSKEPPLYKGFPTLDPEKPLIINCAGTEHSSGAASFFPEKNEIGFVDKKADIVVTLSHELRHAEQYAQLEHRQIMQGNDNLAKQWIFFMDEWDAFLTSAIVCAQTGRTDTVSISPVSLYKTLSEKYVDKNGHKDMQKIRQEIMERYVHLTAQNAFFDYNDQAEMCFPIKQQDVGLKNIPEHYGLTNDFLDTLKQLPREAQSPTGKVLQYFTNHQESQIAPFIKEQESEHPFIKTNILNAFLDKDYYEAPLFQKLLTLQDGNGKNVFDKKDLADTLVDSVPLGRKQFEFSLKAIQGESKFLPLTSDHFTSERGKSNLLKFYPSTPKGFDRTIKMLPIVLKLKGNDGKPLIKEEQLAQELGVWLDNVNTPENLQILFNAIKDEKGNLPISREVFDIHNQENKNGQNTLLTQLKSYKDVYVQNSLAILPILMALKDKDGKPIISQENIDKFPENTPLSEAVKAYKRTGIQQELETQAKAGAKTLEQNPEYVKKGQKSAKNSVQVSTSKTKASKEDFSL